MTLAAISGLVNDYRFIYIFSKLEFYHVVIMAVSAKKLSRNVTITNELGLHARSAARIAKIALNSKAWVWIKKGAESADASSIIDILSLACEKGSKITLIIEDPSDMDILETLVNLVEQGFGE
jgi:phosphocarrier protein HPr